MKRKDDFITNSSSTNYIITSFKDGLTAREFVVSLFSDPAFIGEMDNYIFEHTMQEVIESLEEDYDFFPMKEGRHLVTFGDVDGNAAGRVFDYCLRQGFRFNDFEVQFESPAR